MKNLLLILSLIFSSYTVSAQISMTKNTHKKTQQKVTNQIDCNGSGIENDTICYSEISKASYYHALIKKNNFDIKLKTNTDLSIKKDLKFISKDRDMILYATW